jgi:methionyl-tRNA formyltransferase
MPTRLVFMGTPEFAVPSLHALTQAPDYAVVGVVTQPDRPAGRGRQLIESAVKQTAHRAGIPVIQPEKLREPAALEQLRQWQPEVIVVAAFGQILRPAVLDLPPHGCVNVHGSLLPRHRGAAPIAAALLAGEAETGITIMRMDAGLDTGPMLSHRAEPIRADDTTATLAERLAHVGAALLVETLPAYLAGALAPQAQDNALATYAPQLKKEDGHLDFTQTAQTLERRLRAMTPWPGAFALWNDQMLKIIRAEAQPGGPGEPGRVSASAQGPVAQCGAGQLLLRDVQPPGKRPMPAADFARGARAFIGAVLR